MAGYLDEYGVESARRSRTVRRLVLGGLVIAVLAIGGYFLFRNWSEQRVASRFLDLLRAKKYQDAYELWRTPETNKYYPAEKFLEDWGSEGRYKNAEALDIVHDDSCGGGVVFAMRYPGEEEFGLWVDGKTKAISFAPEAHCGRHLQIMDFLRERFGGGA